MYNLQRRCIFASKTSAIDIRINVAMEIPIKCLLHSQLLCQKGAKFCWRIVMWRSMTRDAIWRDHDVDLLDRHYSLMTCFNQADIFEHTTLSWLATTRQTDLSTLLSHGLLQSSRQIWAHYSLMTCYNQAYRFEHTVLSWLATIKQTDLSKLLSHYLLQSSRHIWAQIYRQWLWLKPLLTGVINYTKSCLQ